MGRCAEAFCILPVQPATEPGGSSIRAESTRRTISGLKRRRTPVKFSGAGTSLDHQQALFAGEQRAEHAGNAHADRVVTA